ncbi:WD repeat-containing protein 33 [Coemansia sp. RSA 2050]|nr:WD repeat-containing protein 33 [Coemansia sp. RSA 2050]
MPGQSPPPPPPPPPPLGGNVGCGQQMRPPNMQPGYGNQHQGRPFMQMPGGQMGMRGPGNFAPNQQRPMPYNGQLYQQQRPPMFNNGAGGYGQQQQQQQQQQARFQNPQQAMYRPHHQYGNPSDAGNMGPKRQLQRRTIDYYGATVRGLEMRAGGGKASLKCLPGDPSYTVDVVPPFFVAGEPETSITTRYVQQAQNKARAPVNVIRWTPDSRRLVTGSYTGELTLWNGLSFNFDTIMQAHDSAIRSMEWSHNAQWMITGDQGGIIKYWQPNMNNVKVTAGHKSGIHGLSFSPSDTKFASASDDQQIKIWDFIRGPELVLSGHTWEVRTVDWHPHLGMIATGGKDNVLKTWDPRSGKCLASLRRHNNSITELQWNSNGRWLLSGGSDHCVKLFDIRKFREEVHSYATKREVHSVAWHPQHETLFAAGASHCDNKRSATDGSIQFWMTDDLAIKGEVQGAHSSQIWSLAWHPMGHVLASGSNDHTTKFWCRPRPAELLPTELGGRDVDERIFGELPNRMAAERLAGFADAAPEPADDATVPKLPVAGLPGLQSADISRMLAKIKMEGTPSLPGLGDTNAQPVGLPGLGGPQQRAPLPPPVPPHMQGTHRPFNGPPPQHHGYANGPMRNMDNRGRPPSRFSPMQRGGPPQRPPRPPPNQRR